jgi:putative redox protein
VGFEVELRNVDGSTTALGTAGPHSVVVDRPTTSGGGGLGFNGGQLLHLAVAGCISNDLFREAALRGIELTRVLVKVDGDYDGAPAVSTGITYSVEVEGNVADDDLRSLVDHVDAIAEIPNSLRNGTTVRLADATVKGRIARAISRH